MSAAWPTLRPASPPSNRETVSGLPTGASTLSPPRASARLPARRRRRRHLHRPAAARREERPASSPPRCPRRPSDSSIGVLNGIEKICREAGIDPSEIDRRDARHDGRHQHGADRHRRAGRPRDHQGLSRRCCRSPAPSCPAASAAGSSTTSRRRSRRSNCTIEADERIGADGEVVSRSTRRALRRDLADAPRQGHRGAHRLADQRLRQRRARAAHRGDRARGAARHPGLALLGGRAGNARVRAHRDHGGQFLRPSASSRNTSTTCSASSPNDGAGVQAAHPALRRRPGLGAVARGAAGQPADVRPGRAASPARSGSPSRRASRTSSPSTWAARRPTSR